MSQSLPVGFATRGEVASVHAQRQREQQRARLEQILAGLPESQRRLYTENPHLLQLPACARPLKREPLFTIQDRILHFDTAPRAPYRRREKEIKTVEHRGQRKLILVEIEFLSRFAQPGDVIIYAGGAGGAHHLTLSTMFPDLDFILYDPRPFARGVRDLPRYEVRQEFFTISTAQELATRLRAQERRYLFLSDIRRAERGLPELVRQQLILEDLEAQRTWVMILNPVASLLKFVMPYPMEGIPNQVNYFDGTIFIQPYAGATSSETRLLVLDPHSTRRYDIKQYEDVMFYYNTVTRTTYYENVEHVGCHCYDCAAELFILNQYARRRNTSLKINQLIEHFNTVFRADLAEEED